MRGREDEQLLGLGDDLAGQRMQVGELLDLVAEELDPHGQLLVHREDLDDVAAHPERATGERQIVARVLDVDQPAQQGVAVVLLADREPHAPVDVLLRGAEAVDARHRRDDHHIAAGQQAHRRRVTQPLDLVVDRRILLDVGIGLRDVGLRLVVVVVRDEVLDRVVRQQLAELIGQLSRQGLVGREHEGRALQLLDEPRRRRALAGARGAQQHQILLAMLDALGQLSDGGGLITARLEIADDLERTLAAGDVTLGARNRGAHD